MTTPEMRHPERVYLLAALGLLVVTLSAFAVIWPFNGTATDDWAFPYLGQQGTTGVASANRDYIYVEAVLAHWLLPGRVQVIHITHLLCIWGASVGLFYLLNRLNPGHSWFAFLYAALYLVYIPFNIDQARPLQSAYLWIVALVVIGAALLVKQLDLCGGRVGLVLLSGSVMGYVACRATEGTIFLLAAAPGLLLLATRRLSKRLIISAGLWWLIIGIGVLRFAIPFMKHDRAVAYQEEARLDDLDISTLWSATQVLFQNAFPTDRFLYIEYDYLVPALALALMFSLASTAFWRRAPTESALPSARRLVVMLGVGLLLVELGGGAYTLTKYLYRTERAHFLAAPGEALVVTSALGLAAWTVQRTLLIPGKRTLAVLTFGVFVLAAHWYHDANNKLYDDQSNLFNVKNFFFRDVAALVPGLTEKTAIIYYCEKPTTHYQFWRAADIWGGAYLYADSQGILFSAGKTPTGVIYHTAHFDQEGVTLNAGTVLKPPRSHYRYAELVVLACQEDGGLRILDRFPPKLAPAGAALDTYNPYARIVPGFIPPERARILAQ